MTILPFSSSNGEWSQARPRYVFPWGPEEYDLTWSNSDDVTWGRCECAHPEGECDHPGGVVNVTQPIDWFVAQVLRVSNAWEARRVPHSICVGPRSLWPGADVASGSETSCGTWVDRDGGGLLASRSTG